MRTCDVFRLNYSSTLKAPDEFELTDQKDTLVCYTSCRAQNGGTKARKDPVDLELVDPGVFFSTIPG